MSTSSSFSFNTVMNPCPGGHGPGNDKRCVRCVQGLYSVDGGACKSYVPHTLTHLHRKAQRARIVRHAATVCSCDTL